MRIRLITITTIVTIFLALAPTAYASHFRGAAMIPSVTAAGEFTVTTTAFWRKGQSTLSTIAVIVTKPDGSVGGTMTNSAPVIDASDSRFDMSTVTSQITLAGGAGVYQLRWTDGDRVAGMRNGDPAVTTWDMRSAIYWDGSTASTPIQFNFQAINNEVVRDDLFSQFLGAVASSGLTLSHDSTLNAGILAQPPGFAVNGSTGEMTIPAGQTGAYLDNSADATNGADYAFSGRILASNGSYVGFDWVLNAVDTSTAPQIDPTPAGGVTPDGNGLVSYQFTGTNPLGGGLTWSWIGLVGPAPPIAPSFDPSSATLTWNTVGSQAGTYFAQVRASNGTNTASQLKIIVPPDSAPANTVLPQVSGTTIVGQTLTATPGTWTGYLAPSYGYQWLLCDFLGGNCQPIQGATGQTYVIGGNAVNGRIAVTVTATNATGSVSATSLNVGPVSGPPYNSSVPTISGTVQVDQTLTASPGTWLSEPPATLSYQWQRCDNAGANCVDVATATGQTYVVDRADVLSTLRVVVTGSNAIGQASAVSAATIAVPAVAPTNSVLPSITGTLRVGELLTAGNGTWDGTPSPAFAHQWQRCTVGDAGSCVDIVGATASTYTTTAAERGLAVRVTVTASNAGGSLARSSALTGAIQEGPINTVLPSITGTVADGQTLTATIGTWTGVPTPTYAYQWQRCDNAGANCVDILTATANSYEATSTDVGKTVRVQVTATNSVASASASSAASGVAPLALTNTVVPAVSGVAKDGRTLTATTGTWTGSMPIAYAYQWQRCDSLGASCADIPTATSQTYVLTSDDALRRIRVQVTATNAAGPAAAVSATTGLVQAIALVNTVAPSITGTPRDQQSLTADKGSWAGSTPILYAYQWQRCDADGGNCVDIQGETNVKYELVVRDIGSTISVAVTASNPDGSKRVSSEATRRIQAIAVAAQGVPGIVGSASEKQTLTASTGSWEGSAPSFTYQWSRCDRSGLNCQDIHGATEKSYTLTGDDVGYTIRVTVTATNYSSQAVATSTWTGITAPDHVAVNVIVQPTSNEGRSKLPGHLPPATATEFTTTSKVTLKIASPSAATKVIVSNKPDFSDAQTFDVTQSGQYPWQVLEDGEANGQRTVYVRWEGEGVDPSLTATAGVLLDDKAPVVSNHRYVYENRVKGKRYRVWVAMRTVDPASGVKYMQFAPSQARPFSWRSYLAKASVRTRQSFIWVRTADAAGNASAWRKIGFPRKAVRKGNGSAKSGK